jgi:MFS family permease
MRPKPGIIPLRPLVLGEVFDGGFQAIRSNPRTMIGLSGIVLAIVTLVSAIPQAALMRNIGDNLANAAPTMEDQLNMLDSSLQASTVGGLITMITMQIITAMLVLAVSSAVLGQKLSPGEAWRRVRGRVFAVLGLTLVQSVALIATLVVPVMPGIVVGVSGSPVLGVILGLIGFLIGVGLTLFLAVRWTFSGPALLLEEQNILAALRRSFRLVRGSFWRVLGITLLAQLIVGIGSSLIQMPFSLISAVFQLGGDTSGIYQDFWRNLGQLTVSGVGQVIAGAVFYPFVAAVTTLLYIDVRMRREGLDVELLRACEPGSTT